MDDEKIKKTVREEYGKIAKKDSSCCGPPTCCGGQPDMAQDISRRMGYTEEELGALPRGANLGLGCGNPVAMASLTEGETVLDLGSGAGVDCFLAAQRVGGDGKVIGIDMTHEMLQKARENAKKGGFENVEFRLGEIENLPVADNSVDIVISNCVINLVPDKSRAFSEIFRVLKSGGRFMISDIVLLKELPKMIKDSIDAYVGCISGALLKEDYLSAIRAAGFKTIEILDEAAYLQKFLANEPTTQTLIKNLDVPPKMIEELAGTIISIKVKGVKS